MTDLPPGRELDVLICTKVMGFKNLREEEFCGIKDYVVDPTPEYVECIIRKCGLPVPHYSTSISDAWDVVEKLMRRKYFVSFELTNEITQNTALDGNDYPVGDYYFNISVAGNFTGCANTAPLAICLAALKAIEK